MIKFNRNGPERRSATYVSGVPPPKITIPAPKVVKLSLHHGWALLRAIVGWACHGWAQLGKCPTYLGHGGFWDFQKFEVLGGWGGDIGLRDEPMFN